MNSLFNPDNPIFSFLSRITDIVILNLLCILCCIPIVTIVPSLGALYYCMLKIVRDRDSSIIAMFFHSFRTNLKQGSLMTVLFITMALFLVIDIRICNIVVFSLLKYIKFLLYLSFFILFVIISYAIPLLAQFENSTRNILKNAIILAFTNLGYTAIIVVLNALPLIQFWGLPEFSMFVSPIWLTFGIALIALINTKIFVKIFDKFIH